MTRFLTDRIRLPLILCHSRMNSPVAVLARFNRREYGSPHPCLLDDIWTDWGLENCRKRVSGFTGSSIRRSDGDGRTCRHLD